MTRATVDPYDIPNDYPGCLGCGHYRAARCIAFPKAIPLMILSGQMHHLSPVPGQVGDTVFTPLDLEIWQKTHKRVPARSTTATTSS